jgi:hypothetical protein
VYSSDEVNCELARESTELRVEARERDDIGDLGGYSISLGPDDNVRDGGAICNGRVTGGGTWLVTRLPRDGFGVAYLS